MSELAYSTLGACVTLRGERADPQAEPAGVYIGLDSIDPHTMTVTRSHTCKEFESSGVRVQAGDILYGRLRPYLNKVTVAKTKAIASGEFIVLEARPGISSDYLCYAMHSKEFVQFACSKTTGDRPRVKFEHITSYQVSIPPLPEQRAIVAKIEALFSELDRGRASLEAARARLKTYRQAVLKSAFEGYTDTCLLGELLIDIEAGKSLKCVERTPHDHEDGVVKISAVTWGTNDENESKTLPMEVAAVRKYLIQNGDFLFSRANTLELVGACVIVRETYKRIHLSDKILRFKLKPNVDPSFVLHFLKLPAGRREIENKATGNQLSMRNITQPSIRAIALPMLPYEAQSRIVADIESRLSLAEALGKSIDEALIREAALRQAILKKAFEGRLLSAAELAVCREAKG